MVVPAEEERTAKVVVAAVSCYRWRACADVNDTRSDIMTSRFQSSPALTTALLLLLLDTVFATVSITRHHRGDVFDVSDVKCSMETCVGVSSGTASLVDAIVAAERDYPSSVGSRGYKQSTGTSMESLHNGNCRCQCIQPVPVFRDDLRICVDDLQECSLASFVSGTTVQKIPYVFLPLQGQIVYPSAEIKIAGIIDHVSMS
eukprot:XP_016659996.1 PREDICTED: uncharacterized protein LOC100573451 [Acyrthosiphon pisum]